MRSQEILKTYLDFYKERGHELIPNVSLVPENDPTLLFVNSGMFPLVPYLSGQEHPQGKRLMNVQRCLRFDDLENVGTTNRHTVAFHMIGNWSLGDYFKEEQLAWVYELFIERLGLDINRIYATVFAGDADAPRDKESIDLLKGIFSKYGLDAKEDERIFAQGKSDNWWMRGEAVGELGGPDSEIYYYIGKDGTGLGKNPVDFQDDFIEIGNSVFMQYRKNQTGWEELPQKNVDFGGGLERIALAVQNKADIFQTDNFYPLILEIEKLSQVDYAKDQRTTKAMRTIADHIRACTFLAMDSVRPANKDQGYVLRRLIRRMVRFSHKEFGLTEISKKLVPTVAEIFATMYPQITDNQDAIISTLQEEENKFLKTLNIAQKKVFAFLEQPNLTEETLASQGFDFYQSYGYPYEIFIDDIVDKLQNNLNTSNVEVQLKQRITEHQIKSREGASQKFKGGLASHEEQIIKYHTATHLLHWALREVLGTDTRQMGSNITNERLRFDFTCNKSPTDNELKKVTELINQKINQAIPVKSVQLNKEEAEKAGALHFFGEKYGDIVTVYYIGDTLEDAISKEFCGGPHANNTLEIGQIEIFKSKSTGTNTYRIYLRNTN